MTFPTRIKWTVVVALVLLVGTSCDGDEPMPKSESKVSLAFVPVMSDDSSPRNAVPATRDATTTKPLEDYYGTFAVWTWKTATATAGGTTTGVMDCYEVDYDAANKLWHYHDLGSQYEHYWDLTAAKYSFAACAPKRPTSTSSLTDAEAYQAMWQAEKSNVTWNDDDQQMQIAITDPATDWVTAHYERDLTTLNTSAEKTAAVSMLFQHVTAKVEFYIYSLSDAFTTSFNLATDNIHTRGTFWETPFDASTSTAWAFNTNYGLTTNATDIAADAPLAFSVSNLSVTATKKADAHLLKSYIVLPQTFGTDGMQFRLTDFILNGTAWSKPPRAMTITGTWERNTIYRYYLTIDASNEIILFDLAVAPWTPDDDTDVSAPLTNW